MTPDDAFEIFSLRTSVFYLEQRIDEEELDARDREPTTQHVWLADDRGVASYLRVIENATPQPGDADARRLIGRVVTRADRRGEGLSSLLLRHVIAQFGHEPLALHSQRDVQPLYARLGFEPYGDEYVEAGIPHIGMRRAPTG